MNYEKYPDGRPNLRDIDDVSPDNPVCIVHVTGHFVLVNSVALRLAEWTTTHSTRKAAHWSTMIKDN